MKEENEMLQNEMTRLREVRKITELEDYGANVQNMKQRIDEYTKWLRGDTEDDYNKSKVLIYIYIAMTAEVINAKKGLTRIPTYAELIKGNKTGEKTKPMTSEKSLIRTLGIFTKVRRVKH